MLLVTQQKSEPLAENSTGEFYSCQFFRIELIKGVFLFVHPRIESVQFTGVISDDIMLKRSLVNVKRLQYEPPRLRQYHLLA